MNKIKYCLLFLSMFVFLQVSAQSEDTGTDPGTGIVTRIRTGLATYYHKRFEGRRTTSGAKYRAKKFTCAHMSLPLGTIVTVTNLDNGKSVEVEVNDRGPHSKRYIIDVSESAAKELGFYNKGQSKVSIAYGQPS
ncbi:septal ring lytic transglycosylase RlpA family protein [Pedobacter sp. MC2016-15]|uniref:septal ring lytic transglycosylase RlpA family protein n=1 Tax=Pedobacter sp. MC2016-15 TaxID=2994473 RepID=UPI002246301D|nr:septal ring lytic transglycosylase RlpA family protein [Pedobacter sp. MC2016-15]MCX2479024.1 septal ring lytic transglycosylase RlpA family protein [Pedobacter sp. MC2016-15]